MLKCCIYQYKIISPFCSRLSAFGHRPCKIHDLELTISNTICFTAHLLRHCPSAENTNTKSSNLLLPDCLCCQIVCVAGLFALPDCSRCRAWPARVVGLGAFWGLGPGRDRPGSMSPEIEWVGSSTTCHFRFLGEAWPRGASWSYGEVLWRTLWRTFSP